jgi:Excalibur calcium-binding domain
MIKAIVIAMLLLSISSSALAKGKKIESQKVAAGSLQPHILDKFKNCSDAKAHGVFDVRVKPGYQPPGWRRSADANKNGIACERTYRD